MRKRLFQTTAITFLFVALFSIFAVIPASAASHHVTASTRAAVSTTAKIPASPWCQYRVNTPGSRLNVRVGPGLGYWVRYTLGNGTIIVADQAAIYADGHYWHQVADNYPSDYVAGDYIVRAGGICIS